MVGLSCYSFTLFTGFLSDSSEVTVLRPPTIVVHSPTGVSIPPPYYRTSCKGNHLNHEHYQQSNRLKCWIFCKQVVCKWFIGDTRSMIRTGRGNQTIRQRHELFPLTSITRLQVRFKTNGLTLVLDIIRLSVPPIYKTGSLVVHVFELSYCVTVYHQTQSMIFVQSFRSFNPCLFFLHPSYDLSLLRQFLPGDSPGNKFQVCFQSSPGRTPGFEDLLLVCVHSGSPMRIRFRCVTIYRFQKGFISCKLVLEPTKYPSFCFPDLQNSFPCHARSRTFVLYSIKHNP